MPRAVALFSGGLDSMLSLRIMQRQGFEVDALSIRTLYSCCRATAAQTAVALGARLTVLSVGDDYLEVIRNPSYGYGRGVNPCVDCRVYMCRMAKRLMEDVGACVVVTGEIAGQRPMSQKKHQLEIIARRSGLESRLLRPLSARLLPPTAVELEGLVDRRSLYAFSGRGRRPLIELAERLGIGRAGIRELPSPSTGCALTESSFAPRVRDLMQHHPRAGRWDFELLSYGRHFRFDGQTKIVVGRDAAENASLELLAGREDAPQLVRLVPERFRGPVALVVGPENPAALEFAGALILRYTRRQHPNPGVRIARPGASQVVTVQPSPAAQSAITL